MENTSKESTEDNINGDNDDSSEYGELWKDVLNLDRTNLIHACMVKSDMIFIVLRLEDHFNTDSEDSLFEGGENEDSDEDENEPIEIPWVEETEISRRVENNEDDPFPDTASMRYNMK